MRFKACWKVYQVLKKEGKLGFMDLGEELGYLLPVYYANNHPNFNILLLKLQAAQLITKCTPTLYTIGKNVEDPKEFDTLLRDASCRLKSLYEGQLPFVGTLKLNYNTYCKKCKRPLTPSTVAYLYWDYKYCKDCWKEAVKKGLEDKLMDTDKREKLEGAIAKADLNLLPKREL